MAKNPQGFERVSQEALEQEGHRVAANDPGRKNTHAGPLSYSVRENTSYFGFIARHLGLNHDFKSVNYESSNLNDADVASITSKTGNKLSTLTGFSDGRVELKVYENDALKLAADITQHMAGNSITAKDIRERQQSMSADGKLTPKEQTNIDVLFALADISVQEKLSDPMKCALEQFEADKTPAGGSSATLPRNTSETSPTMQR